jgi:V/A-type H+-transporting ATPase subunit I
MALGLASIAMADLAHQMMSSGAMIGGIAAGIFFHLLNFVIGVVSPAIQSARLHYVEFFSQFFDPARERYRPLTGPG